MKSSPIATYLAAAVVLAGCSDGPTTTPPNSSPPKIDVSLTGPASVTAAWEDNRVACRYTIRAAATGDPGATAEWTRMWLRVRSVQGNRVYEDSITAADVRGLFGASEIRPGQVQEANVVSGFVFNRRSLENAAAGAHYADWTFQYYTAGAPKTTSYSTVCNSPPPPVIILPSGRYASNRSAAGRSEGTPRVHPPSPPAELVQAAPGPPHGLALPSGGA
ncbi:MAG TPA: hypothetical protein VHG28_17065 [Longimicrobiaceae bacterium]|nr:hypothetical protein [Longimicrobiaceae bacterium]